ncbi:MAG: hypothetical protein IT517_04130 [Burkholderiales bacterium]|nr:hypothetical protein [Burkholderiales bacterium]
MTRPLLRKGSCRLVFTHYALLRLTLPVCVGLACAGVIHAAEKAADTPVAVVFGQPIHVGDLTAPGGAKATDAAGAERAQGEVLRARVWSAVFEEYARRRRIEPTEAEIDSQIEGQRRMTAHLAAERLQQREASLAELESPGSSEARRQVAQQHLDTLDRLAEFDAQRARELRDPAQQKLQRESERRVAAHWVRRWKLDQALFREFGGRIVFQQAGWEPIDAYRKLLEQAEARGRLVLSDPAWRTAVYRYFEHRFVYADEAMARFYFERPYWERTPEQMKAAGF